MTSSPDFLSEKAVLQRFPMLTERELRAARRKALIEWYAFKFGPHYVAEGVEDYIARTYHRPAKIGVVSSKYARAAPAAPPVVTPAIAALSTQAPRRFDPPKTRPATPSITSKERRNAAERSLEQLLNHSTKGRSA